MSKRNFRAEVLRMHPAWRCRQVGARWVVKDEEGRQASRRQRTRGMAWFMAWYELQQSARRRERSRRALIKNLRELAGAERNRFDDMSAGEVADQAADLIEQMPDLYKWAAALKWYADERRYDYDQTCVPYLADGGVLEDTGERAREALEAA